MWNCRIKVPRSSGQGLKPPKRGSKFLFFVSWLPQVFLYSVRNLTNISAKGCRKFFIFPSQANITRQKPLFRFPLASIPSISAPNILVSILCLSLFHRRLSDDDQSYSESPKQRLHRTGKLSLLVSITMAKLLDLALHVHRMTILCVVPEEPLFLGGRRPRR